MSWCAKETGGYGRTSDAALSNTVEIYKLLQSCGWTLNAVCGLLGNIEAESAYNPFRWEGDSVQPKGTSKAIGYGFVQFTPAAKYQKSAFAATLTGFAPNYSDSAGKLTDAAAQILFINAKADYYSTAAYPINYSQFKKSTLNAGELAAAWLYNYERPAAPQATIKQRQEAAEYWFMTLQAVKIDPAPPWYEKDGTWKRAADLGLFDGTRPTETITRAEAATVALRVIDYLKGAKQ